MPELRPGLQALFDVRERIAVITGGSGQLGRAMAIALAQAGAQVVVLGRHVQTAQAVATTIQEIGGTALGIACDVRDRSALEQCRLEVRSAFGPVDILINAAGGNSPAASTSAEQAFFDLDTEAVSQVLGLNVMGTLQSCQIFAQDMVERGQGSIVNIASMSALRPLTRVPAYGAAKAAVANFTQWLAVHMAQEYTPHIRVNALAPGFFLTEQNRYLLLDAEGQMTSRGQAIISHTPAGRLGLPEDLLGALLWLVSPASAFVTGAVIPVDGGFSAFSGV
jgi:NAD(P)-dependent dehydrogenase (short-subunit alcohol dehydrogenase family)